MQFQKNKNVFDLRKNIFSRNLQNIEFNTLTYQHILTALKIYTIAKYVSSLFFIHNVVKQT